MEDFKEWVIGYNFFFVFCKVKNVIFYDLGVFNEYFWERSNYIVY